MKRDSGQHPGKAGGHCRPAALPALYGLYHHNGELLVMSLLLSSSFTLLKLIDMFKTVTEILPKREQRGITKPLTDANIHRSIYQARFTSSQRTGQMALPRASVEQPSLL